MTYRPDIDGLRALAVLAVMFYHANLFGFSGGFIGVDVFFVISGYLITTIILDRHRSGNFSFFDFYNRRARRILPALFLLLFVCMPIAWLTLSPVAFREFAASLGAASLFSSNILFWLEIDYFNADIDVKPLIHTWSLGVEEQYYLLFPLFFAAFWKWRPKTLRTIIAAMCFASFSLGIYAWYTFPVAGFYLAPMRIWEIFAGSLCAFSSIGPRKRYIVFLPPLGLLLIGIAAFFYSDATPFPHIYALAPVIGAVLIISFLRSHDLLAKALSLQPVVFVGLISYSAYLWHQPVLAFAHIHLGENPSSFTKFGLLNLSLGFAFLSWRFVERPFRHPRSPRKLSPSRTVYMAVGSLFAIATAGFWFSTSGLHDVYYRANLTADDARLAAVVSEHTDYDFKDAMRDDGACRFWVLDPEQIEKHRFDDCAKKFETAVVVLGDSHAMNIFNMLFEANDERFLVGIAQPGCRPHDILPRCHLPRARLFLQENKAVIRAVYYHQSGSHLLANEGGENDRDDIFDPSNAYFVDIDNIRATIDYLEPLAEHNRVTWLGPFIEARIDFQNLEMVKSSGLQISGRIVEAFDDLEIAIKSELAERKNDFTYLSLKDVLRANNDSIVADDCLMYRDRDHFSICGERHFSGILSKRLKF